MTQDLKLTVYGLASDGRDGTNLYFFDTEKDRDDSIWETITPEDEWNENDTDQLPVDPVEYRARFNGDWSDAYDHYRPEYLTLSLNEYNIDLSTVPAVAALVERVKVLEDFRARVAGHMTTEDMVRDDNASDYEPTQEDIEDMRSRFDDESMLSDHLFLEQLADEARDLALPDTAKEGGAA